MQVNHIMYSAAQRFGLSLGDMSTSEKGDLTAIWDGENIVFSSEKGTAWWWDAARMFWKYGLAPYRAVNLVKSVVGTFLKLYEPPYFPFRSLTQRVYELGLQGATGVTGEQFLASNNIDAKFSRHILQAATRVNYASNLAHIHGLETMVSFATDGAVAVDGGNWQIFDRMVHYSGAAVCHNTSVHSISLEKRRVLSQSPTKYLLSTAEGGALPTVFDNVIIATPWQFSNISAGVGVIRHRIDTIPYTKLHVTLFTSPFKLRAGFFGLEDGAKAPSSVYTTLRPDEEPKQGAEGVGSTGFYSVSTLRTVLNPQTQKREYLYKIFSAEAVTPEFLEDLLGAHVPKEFVGSASGDGDASAVETISWYYPHWFHSYPIELPRVTFQDPILGDGLFYTSGIESFISTMETSALMGMNVARLIADDARGLSGKIAGGGPRVMKNERPEREDFFDSLGSELEGMMMMGPDEL